MSRFLKIFITVSVLLNLLMAGVIIGDAGRYVMKSHVHRTLQEMAAMLPEDKREHFEDVMGRAEQDTGELRQQLSDARKKATNLLKAEPFDKGAYLVEMQEVQQMRGQIMQRMAARRIHVKGARVLVLGVTFKENCPDIRNSKVFDVVRELANYGAQVEVYDPWADSAECKHEYGMRLLRSLKRARYDAVVIAVAHREFRALGARGARRLCKKKHVLYDIKSVFPAADVDGRL